MFSQINDVAGSPCLEGFDDGDPPGFDPVFSYQIEFLDQLDAAYWEVDSFSGQRPALKFRADSRALTYQKQHCVQLVTHKHADFVSEDVLDYGGNSSVRFIGSD